MTTAEILQAIRTAGSPQLLNVLVSYPAADRDCWDAARDRADHLLGY